MMTVSTRTTTVVAMRRPVGPPGKKNTKSSDSPFLDMLGSMRGLAKLPMKQNSGKM